MVHIKQILLCIILLFIFTAILSCGDGTVQTDDENFDESTSLEEETSDTKLYPDVPEVNYNGETFHILGTSQAYGYGYYQTKDVWVSEMNGEAFNDAIIIRNQAVEDKINVKISFSDSDNVYDSVVKSVSAGDNAYDLVYGSWPNVANLSIGGYLTNLNNLEHLDFNNPWWDNNLIEQTAISNKVYYISGELSILANDCTRFVYFNKKIIDDYNLEIPYELVYDNNWVFDKYSEMAKSVYTDLNGDGAINEGDRFGMFHETGTYDFLFIGCGQSFIELDKDGYPRITFLNNNTFTVIEKIFDLIYDKNASIKITDFKNIGGFSNVYAYGRSLFTQDQMLFTIAGTIILNEFRDMESDFGMIPFPKYSSEQENYAHYIDSGTNMVAVPKTIDNAEKTAIFMEYFSAESMYILRPAYYETVLKRKYTRDNESEAMLDIIYQSKIYPLGLVQDIGGLMGIMQSAYNVNRIPSVSDYEKIITAAEAAVEKLYNTYLELE